MEVFQLMSHLLESAETNDPLSSAVGDRLDPTDLECSLCMR